MQKLHIAIIGAGYWGKNLIRVFYTLSDGVCLKYICDSDENKLAKIKKSYPDAALCTNADIIFADPETDAVLIVTPTRQHYDLAKKSLNAGKHTFVEKPFTETSAQAKELIQLAEEKNLILMVDHTFLYTAAVREIKNIINRGELGGIRYIDSERINLGLIQPDVNVIYDLVPHDLSILNYILGENPVSVSAFGKSFVTRGTGHEVEEVAHLNLEYPSGAIAHIHANWLSPVKLRKMIIGGSKKMILFDDIEPSDKIKIFDHGVDIDMNKEISFFPTYRNGDVVIPRLAAAEALVAEANEFINSIQEGRKPLTSGADGLNVVRVLEASTQSIKKGGEKIYIENI